MSRPMKAIGDGRVARITGTGSAFPETRVTNQALAARLAASGVATSDAWIRERTGIVERRHARRGDPSEHNSSLALVASERALAMAERRAEDVELIVYATCTPDTLIPSSACWLQKKLGAIRAHGFDLNAACSGFAYALNVADLAVRDGQAKVALVVGADVLSAFTDWKDRGSCVLFGDGAGAVVVEPAPAESESRILSSHLYSDGEQWDLFHIVAGGSNREVDADARAAGLDKMEMKGRELFKSAVRRLAQAATAALEHNGMTVRELDWLVPHQANLRIIEAVAARLGFPMDKVLLNIDRYGNTSAATVPTVLDEAVRAGRIESGQTLLLDVLGAGLTWGSVLVRW